MLGIFLQFRSRTPLPRNLVLLNPLRRPVLILFPSANPIRRDIRQTLCSLKNFRQFSEIESERKGRGCGPPNRKATPLPLGPHAKRTANYGVVRDYMGALVLRAFIKLANATMMSCQAPGFVQWAVANPARSGREQR